MLETQIRLDDSFQIASRRRFLGSVREFRRYLLKPLSEGLSQLLFFAPKVPVKTSVRQVELVHQVGDRDSLSAPATEVSRRGAHYALVCLFFVLTCVSHTKSSMR